MVVEEFGIFLNVLRGLFCVSEFLSVTHVSALSP